MAKMIMLERDILSRFTQGGIIEIASITAKKESKRKTTFNSNSKVSLLLCTM
ncbi:MAG: hypothetical protein NTW17_01895 [Candidatus Pacearchaeota archaeon]|nr:hypothetical protein [Candidatus Pacearchaeota archaeon]